MNLAIVLQKPMNKAKTRLKNWLSLYERIGLADSMLYDVLNTLSKVSSIDAVGIVTSDARAIAIAKQFGVHIFHEGEDALGMNQAIQFVVETLPRDVQHLFIFPADIPLISCDEITNLVKMVKNHSVSVIPCKKGTGTNVLVLSPPGVIQTAFGLNSREEHCLLAKKAGLHYWVFHSSSLSLDIDTIDDLLLLKTMGQGTKTKDFLERNQIFKC
ncbi:2-phospho-L-lactate guanylyltransferase [Peribacillus glennii]|uniref:2-phospho-L-lactate guanylyltransferase n=1 Tax=Peribacillus glennii TaxID=2303991 RepID=A0A372LF05_9BACI|nr:2-phospho-L-lactate guanylyltransferase [Peribacillus glennii]RFU64870.1 2-phospho-L-lactate guanylyltransferase [Peribacillus glennii]